MTAIYSTKFFGDHIDEGDSLSYTVPAGYIAVLRCVSVTISGSGPSGYLYGNSDLATVMLFEYVANEPTKTVSCRHVFNAGDTFGVLASGGALSAWCSGYLLSSP